MMEENDLILTNPTAIVVQAPEPSKVTKISTKNEVLVSSALEPDMKIKKNYQRKED